MVTDMHSSLRNILLTLEKYVEAMMTVRRGERGEEKRSIAELLCMLVDAHMMGKGGREGGVVTGNVNLLCISVEFKRKNYNATFFAPA